MRLKDIFNIKNIASFIEGNAKYFYDHLVGLPAYQREQVIYRLEKCKEDCVLTGKCKYCGCPVEKKAFVHESCNGGERFPDMMTLEQWTKFKADNGIE